MNHIATRAKLPQAAATFHGQVPGQLPAHTATVPTSALATALAELTTLRAERDAAITRVHRLHRLDELTLRVIDRRPEWERKMGLRRITTATRHILHAPVTE